MFIVEKSFGLITSDSGCRVVDAERVGKELKMDNDVSDVGHIFIKGDEFILDEFCKDILFLLIKDGYIKNKE